jgi:hypothetical protein
VEANKPPGFDKFDDLLVRVPLIAIDPSKPFRFVCGPTCGCGKSFNVTPGTEAVCPHCGKSWGVLNIVSN